MWGGVGVGVGLDWVGLIVYSAVQSWPQVPPLTKKGVCTFLGLANSAVFTIYTAYHCQPLVYI